MSEKIIKIDLKRIKNKTHVRIFTRGHPAVPLIIAKTLPQYSFPLEELEKRMFGC